MDELRETALRRAFQEAVERYRRSTVLHAADWATAWLSAADASRSAEELATYWSGQAAEWGRRAMEAPPPDEEDEGG